MNATSVLCSAGTAWLERQKFGYAKAGNLGAGLADLAAGCVDAVVRDAL